MALAKQLGYKTLQRRTIERLNHEFYRFIEEKLNPDILHQLEEINALRIVDDEIRAWEELFHDSHEEWALNEFIYLKQRGWHCADVLMQQGVRKVAVYGLGNFGDIFYREVKDSRLEIVAAIDRDREGGWHGMTIQRLGDHLPACDAIIVTPLSADKIMHALEGVYQEKRISFRALLASEYRAYREANPEQ